MVEAVDTLHNYFVDPLNNQLNILTDESTLNTSLHGMNWVKFEHDNSHDERERYLSISGEGADAAGSRTRQEAANIDRRVKVSPTCPRRNGFSLGRN